jgi:hypothetical protein
MGAVTSSIKQAMGDAQKEMMGRQEATMKQMQDRQMKVMNGMQVAATRDLVHWMGGVYGIMLTGLTGAAMAGHKIPKVVGAPLFVFTTVLAYQIDFAYGNKADRIRGYYEDIMANEQHWFTKK